MIHVRQLELCFKKEKIQIKTKFFSFIVTKEQRSKTYSIGRDKRQGVFGNKKKPVDSATITPTQFFLHFRKRMICET